MNKCKCEEFKFTDSLPEFLHYDQPEIVDKLYEETDFVKISRYLTVANLGQSASQLASPLFDRIFPPKEWIEDNGNRYRKCVSRNNDNCESTEDLCVKAQKELKLIRNTGKTQRLKYSEIDDRKRIILKDIFDEAIRRVMVLHEEPAVILVRIRDELDMTFNLLEQLFHRSVGLGFTKRKWAYDKIENLKNKLSAYRTSTVKIDRCLRVLNTRTARDDIREKEIMDNIKRKRVNEINYWESFNADLTEQLKNLKDIDSQDSDEFEFEGEDLHALVGKLEVRKVEKEKRRAEREKQEEMKKLQQQQQKLNARRSTVFRASVIKPNDDV